MRRFIEKHQIPFGCRVSRSACVKVKFSRCVKTNLGRALVYVAKVNLQNQGVLYEKEYVVVPCVKMIVLASPKYVLIEKTEKKENRIKLINFERDLCYLVFGRVGKLEKMRA